MADSTSNSTAWSWRFLCVATFSVSWIALRVTEFTTLSDLFLILSIASAGPRAALNNLTRIPSVVVLPIGVLVLLELLQMSAGTSRLLGARMAFALLVCVLAIVPLRNDVEKRRTLTHVFCYGVAASGVVGVLSRVGGMHLRLAGVPRFIGREVGLTMHPNHLGLTCLLGLAATVFSGVASKRPWLRTGLIAIMIGGLFVSGSRAALVGAFFVGLGALWAGSRKRRLSIVASLCVLAVAALIFGGSSVSRLPAFERLFSTTPVAAQNVLESDSSRWGYLVESAHAFVENPIIGSGLDGLRDAHNVYLQVLTSGGVLFLLALLPLFCRAFRTRRRDASWIHDPNSATVAAWLIAGVFMNAIFDRYLYIPLSLAVMGSYWSAEASQAHRAPPVGQLRRVQPMAWRRGDTLASWLGSAVQRPGLSVISETAKWPWRKHGDPTRNVRLCGIRATEVS